MDRSNVRILLYSIIALLITAGSLLYSNHLAGKLAELEEQRIELYADALAYVGDLDNANTGDSESGGENDGVTFVFEKIINTNSEIPTILTDTSLNINSTNNLDLPEDLTDDERRLKEKDYLESIRGKRDPIEITFYGEKNYIWYDDSWILKQFRYYPYIQLLVIIIFVGIIFAGFFIAKRSEQNRVWVGLAKETAHQLGTPVSSLMAWVALLKDRANEDPEELDLLDNLERDVHRLTIVAERFSKIGSKPELIEIPLAEILNKAADYTRKRMSRRVKLELDNQVNEEQILLVNPQLFDWVIENLIKNALDAITGKGQITLHASEKMGEIIIDVEDTGKGIPKHLFKQVFKPGFTTKKRGWGLGLSLTRRIVENYHRGKIFVKHSEVGKGTTFRIVLPKQNRARK